MKKWKLPKISQTTLSAIVGAIGALVYALLPYLQASPNATVRAIAGVLVAVGFGNGIRAAPHASNTVQKDDLQKLPPNEPVTPAAIVASSEAPAKG